MGRYAEGTEVPVDRSRAEMLNTLSRYGVRKFGWDQQDHADMLFFELNGKAYRMKVVQPLPDEFAYNPRVANAQLVAREWRRRWRAVAMMLKMRLEFADSGDSSIEMELMPYLILASGETVGEAIIGGALPLLTANGSR